MEPISLGQDVSYRTRAHREADLAMITLPADNLHKFWRYVAERHMIFIRRHLWHLPPPWTEDPILQRLHLTHVYRDLDRVTRWLTIYVLPDGAKAPTMTAEDCAFNVLVYRRFCRPATFTGLGGPQPRTAWDWRTAGEWLRAAEERGERLFTGAFMLTNAQSHDPKRVLVVRHLEATATVWPQVWADVVEAAALPDAHRALLPLPGMGPFLAYEALIDYCNSGLLPHSLDSWVYVGPGALRGASLVAGRTLSRAEAAELITQLRDEQEAGLRGAGAPLLGPRLTLENVEQCLCELQKCRRLAEHGRAKRRFTHQAEDDGLWDNLPERFTKEALWGR